MEILCTRLAAQPTGWVVTRREGDVARATCGVERFAGKGETRSERASSQTHGAGTTLPSGSR